MRFRLTSGYPYRKFLVEQHYPLNIFSKNASLTSYSQENSRYGGGGQTLPTKNSVQGVDGIFNVVPEAISNAWFTILSRALVKIFSELRMRRGMYKCRHSHSCARAM